MPVRPRLVLVALVCVFVPRLADARQTPAPVAATTRPSLQSHRVQEPPVIDGVLDDDAWRDGPVVTGERLSYNPLHGSKIPQQTKVWIAHDSNFIYFAFQCDDPEPDRIKTSITRRDKTVQDAWVGLSLDAIGTG